MAEQTGISWADATFNPWIGCEKVSPGCAHCYAETLVTGRMGRANTWGPAGVRQRTADGNWRKPRTWNRMAVEGLLPNGNPSEGHRPRVFCASLADVFEPRPELEQWRLDLFRLIEQTPELDWLILTKRPELARDFLRAWYETHPFPTEMFAPPLAWVSRDNLGWGVLPNIWIGTSIENAAFTWRADVLREIPAAVRFISAEPLLGTLFPKNALSKDAREDDDPEGDAQREPGGAEPNATTRPATALGDLTDGDALGGQIARQDRPADSSRQSAPGEPRPRAALDLKGIDWVIVGGESGGVSSRPIHPAWVREIRDAVLGTYEDFRHATDPPPWGRGLDDLPRPALHFKQFGSWAPDPFGNDPKAVWLSPDGRTRSRIAADAFDDLPDGSMRVRYAGSSPNAGGKTLDGVEWCEVPEPPIVYPSLTPA